MGFPGEEDGTPAIPPTVIGKEVPRRLVGSGRTWREYFQQLAHEPIPGIHVPDVDRMMDSLRGVAWWDTMRTNLTKWAGGCRVCASRNRNPRVSTTLRRIGSCRPFTTLVWDLVFLSVKGVNGEIGALSAICAYTKCVRLPPIWKKTARACAWAWLAVVADAGVLPATLYSGREKAFRTQVVLEFTASVNARQGVSLAYAPQGHGLVERPHRELHRHMGQTMVSTAGLLKEE